ncbi:hypothetical protein AAE02nite_21370 [Adhaeribacter aerolatus]|uniref:Type I restriction modification DNA specificity domain-containing protein n=1 Tax=Adhaeribacter aerolatus TaxID=670289 RepID=A0A512AXN8_9BACT|nr:restriction endonuclease subunit S [Adhaeribacter aerolatus]GEO04473.1 hypothetical protein AAE02nite_21370 [Adhaeribacter aerolatus]
MEFSVKDVVSVHSGLYAKPNISGNAIYLQANMFNDFGDLYEGITPNVTIDTSVYKHLLIEGDVIFAAKGVYNFAIKYNSDIGPAVASSTFLVLRPNRQNLLPQYLVWFLNHPISQDYLKSQAKGSSILSISKKILEKMIIPVPSLEKQQQILEVHQLRNREKKIMHRLEELREQLIQGQLLKLAQE